MEYIIKVDGRFYSGAILTDEYPDAEIFDSEKEAISAAKKLDKLKDVEVISDYGLDSQKIVWSNYP